MNALPFFDHLAADDTRREDALETAALLTCSMRDVMLPSMPQALQLFAFTSAMPPDVVVRLDPAAR